jgi:hypothetical protein
MRAGALAFVLALAPLAARADWTVAHRAPLPVDGTPIDLAAIAGPDEDPVRIELTGSYSFLVDGSEIDALSRTASGVRDVSAGFVRLPAGARVIASDETAHRYTIEVPRAASMPIALDATPLAMRYLITAREARANLQGSIELAHLAPPPPPPPASEVAIEAASSFPWIGWASIAAGLAIILGAFALGMSRRRDPVHALVRRADRARAAIGRECAALGPAFDPVFTSADRIADAAARTATHHRAQRAALARTADLRGGDSDRAHIAERAQASFESLRDLVQRLEGIAARLAGQTAETLRANDVDSLVDELGSDLEIALEAQEAASA